MNKFFLRKLVAVFLVLMSVYALIIFIIIKSIDYEGSLQPVVITVVVTPGIESTEPNLPPTPIVSEQAAKPHLPPVKPTRQPGGHTGTMAIPYPSSVMPVHYVVRTVAKYASVHKRNYYHHDHQSRHRHKKHQSRHRHKKHQSRHRHKKHQENRFDKC